MQSYSVDIKLIQDSLGPSYRSFSDMRGHLRHNEIVNIVKTTFIRLYSSDSQLFDSQVHNTSLTISDSLNRTSLYHQENTSPTKIVDKDTNLIYHVPDSEVSPNNMLYVLHSNLNQKVALSGIWNKFFSIDRIVELDIARGLAQVFTESDSTNITRIKGPSGHLLVGKESLSTFLYFGAGVCAAHSRALSLRLSDRHLNELKESNGVIKGTTSDPRLVTEAKFNNSNGIWANLFGFSRHASDLDTLVSKISLPKQLDDSDVRLIGESIIFSKPKGKTPKEKNQLINSLINNLWRDTLLGKKESVASSLVDLANSERIWIAPFAFARINKIASNS